MLGIWWKNWETQELHTSGTVIIPHVGGVGKGQNKRQAKHSEPLPFKSAYSGASGNSLIQYNWPIQSSDFQPFSFHGTYEEITKIQKIS